MRSEEDREERIGPATGIPHLGLDALSSVAYGPEAALALLPPLGAAGIAFIFPNGGGSYTGASAASESLGAGGDSSPLPRS